MKEWVRLTVIEYQNLLWQGTYADYYDGKALAWEDSPHTLREHLGQSFGVHMQAVSPQ